MRAPQREPSVYPKPPTATAAAGGGATARRAGVGPERRLEIMVRLIVPPYLTLSVFGFRFVSGRVRCSVRLRVSSLLFGEPSTCKVKRVRVELRRVHLAHAAAGTRTTRPQTHENTTHYKTSHGRHRQLGRARGLDARELRRGLAGAPHSHATRPRPRSQDAHARPSQLDPT